VLSAKGKNRLPPMRTSHFFITVKTSSESVSMEEEDDGAAAFAWADEELNRSL
jgi:hypothetical protein